MCLIFLSRVSDRFDTLEDMKTWMGDLVHEALRDTKAEVGQEHWWEAIFKAVRSG